MHDTVSLFSGQVSKELGEKEQMGQRDARMTDCRLNDPVRTGLCPS